MARDTTKRRYWDKHIKTWQASGLSQRAYCVREDIKWPTFDYWRRQILSDSGSAASALIQTTGGLTLVPLRVVGKASDETIILRALAGWELRLPLTVNPAWLTDILKRLP